MLSILPYERPPQQRDPDRPFKAYQRPPLATSQAVHNSYYNPFAHSGFISSLQQAHSNHVGEHSKHEAPMDLRPPASMYDSRVQYENSPYMDMASQFPSRIPNIKSEHPGLGHSLYPPVNTNPAHSNGYSQVMDMSTMREMSPNGHPSMPTMNSSVHTPPPGPGGHSDMRTVASLAHVPPSDPFPDHSPTQEEGSHSAANQSTNARNHSSSPSNSVASPSGSTHEADDESKPPKKRPYVVPEDMKDNVYWEKRKKNNDSAKRSREARRMKEEQIAMRVVYLEQDNLQLRTEVSLLKSEIEKLRCMLYNS